jgi:hypothetical protein
LELKTSYQTLSADKKLKKYLPSTKLVIKGGRISATIGVKLLKATTMTTMTMLFMMMTTMSTTNTTRMLTMVATTIAATKEEQEL